MINPSIYLTIFLPFIAEILPPLIIFFQIYSGFCNVNVEGHCTTQDDCAYMYMHRYIGLKWDM